MVKKSIKSIKNKSLAGQGDKIVVILGPTSSGKTALAVKLAFKYKGEIVSADSRQVYRGMDIGTGKDLEEYYLKIPNNKFQIPDKSQILNSNVKKFKAVKIKYHLIDVVSPRAEFNLARYKKMAEKALADILSRGRLPIIAGGSGLYLEALVDNYNLLPVKPDKKLRADLEKKTAAVLFSLLREMNPKFADRLAESDRKNKRRLIRYLEITKNKIGDTIVTPIGVTKNKYEFILIGLAPTREILLKRITRRLLERLDKQGLVDEVKRLNKEGVSWKKLKSFGLEYKYISLYLLGELSYEEMVEKLNIAIRQFAKRQMSWFRRWERRRAKIQWVESEKAADKLVAGFLK